MRTLPIRWPVLGSLVLALALSGCLGGGSPATPVETADAALAGDGAGEADGANASAALATALGRALNATADEEEAGNWSLMVGRAGPDRPMTVFRWTVPAGSVLPSERHPDRNVLPLEAVAMVEDGRLPELDHMMLHVFVVRNGEADHRFSMIDGVYEGAFESVGGTGAFAEEAPAMEPWWVTVDAVDLAAGDEIAFVVAGEASSPLELAVAFRVMDHLPDFGGEEPAPDLDAFLREREGRPRGLEATGFGAGYRYAFYMDLGYVNLVATPPVPEAVQVWSRDATWSTTGGGAADATRPAASVRDLTMSFEQATASGWGFGWGFAMVTAGAGAWSVETDVHGHVVQGSGVLGSFLTAAAGVPALQEAGVMASYLAEGEGNGGATTTFRVTYADPAALTYLAVFEQLDFAVTLTDLLGVPGNAATELWGVEGAPPVPARGVSLDRWPEPVRGRVLDAFPGLGLCT